MPFAISKLPLAPAVAEQAKETVMLYTKPLSNNAPASARIPVGAAGATGKVKRGVPLGAAPDFAAMMAPQGKPAAFPPGKDTAKTLSPTGKAGPTTPEEMAKQDNMGLNQTKAMATLAKVMQDSNKPLATLNSAQGGINGLNPLRLPSSFQRPKGLEGAETDLRVRSHRKKSKPEDRMGDMVSRAMDFIGLRPGQKTGAADNAPTMASSAGNAANNGLGQLTAQFESGKDGIAAIGYDRHGGTSYGKYQISSRAGTMKSFMDFLKTEEPDFAKRLEQAGPANTGGKTGRMPDVWKEIAEQHPERFDALQEKFVRASHFEPALRSVSEKTGLALDDMPQALQEVLFSTAVQHGPTGAARIISRAVDQVGQDKLDPDKNNPDTVSKAGENLIRRIYAMRSSQFGSSTASVQASVKNRLQEEMGVAISMLRRETATA